MKIRLADTDNQIKQCYSLMRQLRPHVTQKIFLPSVREQQAGGYQIAMLEHENKIVAVAGFRLGKNLAWGDFLYVDDLVTCSNQRSQGYGKALLSWLKTYAANKGCQQLHLDSGLQRKEAHKFYEREALCATGFHFACDVGECS